MAKKQSKLIVVLTQKAKSDLLHIWLWNADRYGEHHADQYIAFLVNRAAQVRESTSRPLERSGLRYAVIKRRSSGHGHIVVFRTDWKQLEVLHFFHTAQDWQNYV